MQRGPVESKSILGKRHVCLCRLAMLAQLQPAQQHHRDLGVAEADEVGIAR
jgi:hypothetical protein